MPCLIRSENLVFYQSVHLFKTQSTHLAQAAVDPIASARRVLQVRTQSSLIVGFLPWR